MKRFFALILVLWLTATLQAQNQLLISLETASTELQTGQAYEINIRLDDASEIWLSNLQIRYDPSTLYIIGTKMGSPVQQGTFFNANTSTVLQNRVLEDMLFYSISLLAPAEPASGNGVIGSFRIYPLKAGQTQIVFTQAEITRALFEMRDGQRVGIASESIEFTPVLLDLNITGETVEPPSEATATPLPSETPAIATQNFATAQATLVNVTAAPRIIAQEVPDTDEAGWLWLLAVCFVLTGAQGIIILFFWQRKRLDKRP